MKNAQRLALATCIATLVLIAVGALVRATGSGLGCPDWPTCHGGVIPPGGQEPVIEYTHRFVASLVGLMVIGTAALAWKHYRHAPFALWTAILAVPLVVFQGILGAITVYRELPPEIVATHLLTAMFVLTCELAAAVAMYAEDPVRSARLAAIARQRARPLGSMALAASAWLAAVFWVGGYMAESGASAACADWPTCNGFGVLPAADDQEITHMLHRYLAAGFIFLVAPFILMAWRRRHEVPWASSMALGGATLYTAQVALGALNVWYAFPDALTIAHTAVAACLWFVLSAAILVTYYVPGRVPRHSPARAAGALA